MKLLTSLALAAAGVSAAAVEDKCLICSHVGFASSEDNAIAGKRFTQIRYGPLFIRYGQTVFHVGNNVFNLAQP